MIAATHVWWATFFDIPTAFLSTEVTASNEDLLVRPKTGPSSSPRYVYVGVGGAPTDLAWVERQEEHAPGVRYVPVLIQPNPRHAPALEEIVKERGGAFYPNAAWTRDGKRMRLNVASHPIYKNGLDSLFFVRGRHDTWGSSLVGFKPDKFLPTLFSW
eukprot:s364_g33.t1